MSGVGHAIGKVFKGVVGIVKKIWKPLLIAVAIYFTAGAAAAYFGAASAAGGAAAFAGAEAGAVGSVAGGAALGAAEVGTAAAVGAGAAEGGALAADIGAGAATDAAAGMTIGDAATGAVADAGLGAGGAGAGAAGAIGDGSIMGGAAPVADLTESAASGAYPGMSLGQGADLTQTAASGGIGSSAPGQTSSWWQSSLDTAGKVMKTPGVMQMLSSGINSYQQGQLYNQNLKWMAAHAPGQIQGGVPQGVFSGYAHGAGTNPNVAGENVAAHGRVAPVNTNSAQPNLPGGITADPRSLPGMNQAAATAPYPGYGTPGYGQQSPRSGPPPISQQLAYQDPNQQAGILGGGEMPYVESPYDQSVV